MLSKEECEKALDSLRIFSLQNLNADLRAVTKSNHVIETLIKEHFELVEHATQLQNEVDYYKHEYYAMCDLFEKPQPYKFEDLKPKMWVWDNEDKKCKKIISILIIDVENTNKGTLVKKYFIRFGYRNIKFEENRFFPVTKAIQNEVKDDE